MSYNSAQVAQWKAFCAEREWCPKEATKFFMSLECVFWVMATPPDVRSRGTRTMLTALMTGVFYRVR